MGSWLDAGPVNKPITVNPKIVTTLSWRIFYPPNSAEVSGFTYDVQLQAMSKEFVDRA
jgi:hypothetical protein